MNNRTILKLVTKSRLYLFISLMLISLTGCSQDEINNLLEKTSELESTITELQENIEYLTTNTIITYYDSYQIPVYEENYTVEGKMTTKYFYYDENENVEHTQIRSEDGNIEQYEWYDEFGKIIRTAWCDEFGNITHEKNVSYDLNANSLIIQYLYYDEDGEIIKTEWYDENEKLTHYTEVSNNTYKGIYCKDYNFFDSDGKLTRTEIYDSHKVPLSVTTYNIDEKIISEELYEFGELVQKNVYSQDGERILSTLLIYYRDNVKKEQTDTYDENGIIRLRKIVVFDFLENVSTISYSYIDSDGKKIRNEFYDSNEEPTHFVYFNNYGNVTMMEFFSDGVLNEKYNNFYYDSGNLYYRVTYDGLGDLIKKEYYFYDDNGNISFIKAYDSEDILKHKIYYVIEDNNEKATHIDYYDENGDVYHTQYFD